MNRTGQYCRASIGCSCLTLLPPCSPNTVMNCDAGSGKLECWECEDYVPNVSDIGWWLYNFLEGPWIWFLLHNLLAGSSSQDSTRISPNGILAVLQTSGIIHIWISFWAFHFALLTHSFALAFSSYFLYIASNFNQNLCNWGNTIGTSVSRNYVFTSSACSNKGNPSLTASPKGPFCYVCPPPPSKSPTKAPTTSPSDAPTPVPTVSPTSDYFETAAELKTAVSSGVYTSGDSPYGAIELWDTSRYVAVLGLLWCMFSFFLWPTLNCFVMCACPRRVTDFYR